jgi:hypothetical protein
MAKIERKYLAHFINAAAMGEDNADYERLGKDLEEYSPELSAQVETKKNILGQTSVLVSGYEKTGSVETYYAERGSSLFNRLQQILDNSLILDDVKADVVEVKMWEAGEGTAYPAIRERAYIEVLSYGGDATGYSISFALHYTGNRTVGTFNPTEKVFSYYT